VSSSKRIMIAKREGDLEVFETAKLRRCLTAAMKLCNCDTRLADALARAVKLHLQDWTETAPPTTDYVFRCIRTALTETGMDHVAQRIAGYRRRREIQRRSLLVSDHRISRPAAVPWRKATVARSLETFHGLSHSVARILASEIEQRVLALGYNVVSTALIAELIRSELWAWGLADTAATMAPQPDVAGVRQARKER
jgi:2-phosphoglycerate kinase